jgi:pimeloyl-ACP methyl ester carboxylesterase
MPSPSLPERRQISILGKTISWREAGSGDCLVLVHGVGGSSGSWARQFAAFSNNYRVIAWDAPGYGQSDPIGQGNPSARDYSEMLTGSLQELGVERPHMVGHSLGSIMVAAAIRYQKVEPRSQVFLQPVLGSGMLPPAEQDRIRQARIDDMRRLGAVEFAKQRGRLILSPRASQAPADEAMAVMIQVPEAGYLDAWDMMCRSDLAAIASGRYPTLVVCGADDPVCPPAAARSLADTIAGAEYLCIDGVGHYAAIEAPDTLNEAMARFFAAQR